MQKINLIYWDSANFGDALSPLLVEELSGLKAYHTNYLSIHQLRLMMLRILKFEWHKIGAIVLPWQKTLLGIGSIMKWGKKNSLIWGSGFMNRTDSFQGGKTFAVRGRLTDEKLQRDGFQSCPVYGDPALLLPLWMPPVQKKLYKLSIIPHWTEVDYFMERFGSRYHVIDLRTRDIQKVVDEVAASEYILSTSLHGLIVGHAYQVPSLWIRRGYIDTDGFKFDDYFSSVAIPFYSGFENVDEILESEAQWLSLFREYAAHALINNSLSDIQVNLLKAAPFPLKDKYKSVIS